MPTVEQLNDKGLDSDEIGELTARSRADGLETIDWKNLSDEQVELIMSDHDCKQTPEDGCPVCAKLMEYGKIPERYASQKDAFESRGSEESEGLTEEKVSKVEQINPRE